jgi:hypothetical protein
MEKLKNTRDGLSIILPIACILACHLSMMRSELTATKLALTLHSRTAHDTSTNPPDPRERALCVSSFSFSTANYLFLLRDDIHTLIREFCQGIGGAIPAVKKLILLYGFTKLLVDLDLSLIVAKGVFSRSIFNLCRHLLQDERLLDFQAG